jgi:hypothetical protein
MMNMKIVTMKQGFPFTMINDYKRLKNGFKPWQTVEDDEGRTGTMVSRWWTECRHGSR